MGSQDRQLHTILLVFMCVYVCMYVCMYVVWAAVPRLCLHKVQSVKLKNN